MNRIMPEDVFREISADMEYKQKIGLYDAVKRNNNFYHDKQWQGVNAPDLDKPVLNIIRPSVNYFISQLVADDIGVGIDIDDNMPEQEEIEKVLKNEIDKILEKNRFPWIDRSFLKNAIIDGDGCLYLSWDGNQKAGKQIAKGGVKIETVDNTSIVFGDPSTSEVQEQPFIIVIKRMKTKTLRKNAKKDGVKNWEDITPDNMNEGNIYHEEDMQDGYTDLAVRFWRVEDGSIHWMSCTKDIIYKEETPLGINLYPLVWMPWEKDKNCYHGVSPITGIIQNQVMINKDIAMIHQCQKLISFPKVIYDRTKLPSGWNNAIGKAIAVNGDPNNAIATAFQAPAVNQQLYNFIEMLNSKTKDALGIYDAALGNVRPDNTSAIIAVQQASAQPLVLQKLDHYQAIEDMVKICLAFMTVYYGNRIVNVTRKVPIDQYGNTQEQETQEIFDFSRLDIDDMLIKIDVGASSYYSELMQVQTVDNMMQQGIIPDAVTYLENIPDGYIKNKQQLIDIIKEKQAQVEAQQAMQQMQQVPPAL